MTARREQPFMVHIVIVALLELFLPGPAQAQIGTQPDTEAPQGAVDAEAEKQMAIARYYVDRGNHIGAITRLKGVVTRHRSSQHIEEALARLVESYIAVGVGSEAQTTAAVLMRRFPNSRWSPRARDALRSAGLDPVEIMQPWISPPSRP
jgi:outer membrane protein assembly factor BamD